MIARRWARLVALLDTREDGLSLALARIVAGSTVGLHLLHMKWSGAASLVWVDAAWGGVRTLRDPLLDRVGGATPATIDALLYGTAATALLFTLGCGTRLAAILTWFGYSLLADLNSHSGGSYDELLKNSLLLLILADAGARISIDARLANAPRQVTAWPRWLLAFQLVVMYTATGLQKVSDHWVPWGSHDALWYILQQPTWQRIPMEWVAPAFPFLRLSSVGVWLFEVGAPVLLLAAWYRHSRTRPGWLRATFNRLDVRALFLACGFAMHLGIELSMEVGAFFPATMVLYCAWISPDEWARILRRPRAYS